MCFKLRLKSENNCKLFFVDYNIKVACHSIDQDKFWRLSFIYLLFVVVSYSVALGENNYSHLANIVDKRFDEKGINNKNWLVIFTNANPIALNLQIVPGQTKQILLATNVLKYLLINVG